MGKIKSAKINYAVPGEAMDQKDFEKMVSEAEKGPFHTLKALRSELAKWKSRYSK
ncbi:MAG TPA: hypothetical protein VNW95_07570 [Mucilaginibacter sp.]|jgi:hypothetical protein|nr:hypothetical protein [Mucilaginibacter sp.]